MQKKHIAIILAIVGVLLIAAGGAAGKIAESNKGLNISSGYLDSSGRMVTTDSGVIGRNQEAVDQYSGIRTVCRIAGIGMIVAAAVLLIQAITTRMAPSVYKVGKIESADGTSGKYMIRFDNGMLQTLKAAPGIMLIRGDAGEFEIKKDIVVGFKKK